jgi:hypothetical protein
MTKDRALQLIQEAFDSLRGTDLIEESEVLNSDMMLIGAGSPLDSIGFVTFITDLEERINEETTGDLYLVLNEISEFNADNPLLLVDTLARYIERLTEGEQGVTNRG